MICYNINLRNKIKKSFFDPLKSNNTVEMRRRFQRVFLSSSANRQIVKEETILKAMREVVEPFTLQKLHTYGCIQVSTFHAFITAT